MPLIWLDALSVLLSQASPGGAGPKVFVLSSAGGTGTSALQAKVLTCIQKLRGTGRARMEANVTQ